MCITRALACIAAVLLMAPGLAAAAGDAPGEPDPGAAARQALARYCAPCHAGPGAEPVNFLGGAAGTSADGLARCAERIHFRLAMWDYPRAGRPRPEMPPEAWLRARGVGPAAWREGPALAELRGYMAGLLALTGSSPGRVMQTGGLDPGALRLCRAPGAP